MGRGTPRRRYPTTIIEGHPKSIPSGGVPLEVLPHSLFNGTIAVTLPRFANATEEDLSR